ncbi:hypothetical protein ACFQZS_09545 [Mucilaginibacter calamicampi]|uniref:Natural product n=1 Tax=Mucilaginibacter calamicampi TaxID=1302352 RepID=A0ABW2YXT7_9SPHI
MKVKLSLPEETTEEFVDIENLDNETKLKIKTYLENEGSALASCGGTWKCSIKIHGIVSC